MTERLDPAAKRLRGLTPGQLADEIGAAKAAIADMGEVVNGLKAEAIRRGLAEADGALFHITLSPPTEQQRLDGKKLEEELGAAFVAQYSKTVRVDWQLRCSARIAAAARQAA